MLTIIFGCALICARGEGAAPGTKAERKIPPLSPLVRQVLQWLPQDTETLFVTKGPFTLQVPRHDEKEYYPSLEKILESWSYRNFTGYGRDAHLPNLAGRKVMLAVEGARHFRPPRELGLSLSEGSNILVFQHDLGRVGDSFLKALAADAKKVDRLAGHEVFRFEEQLEKDRWTFFIVQPKPNILVGATDRGYLKELLKRMQRRHAKRAFPEEIPEWKHVDTSARFWAIRHYKVADHCAVGLTFSYDPGEKAWKKRATKVHYLSDDPNALKASKELWRSTGICRTMVKRTAPGVIEITSELKNKRDGIRFLFILLYQLGHAIYC